MALYELHQHDSCTIKHLPNIHLLHSMGLRPGIPVSIVSKQPLGGPIVIQIGARCVALGKDVAEQIEISNIRKQAAFDLKQSKAKEVY